MTKSRWDLFKEAASDVVTAISGITPTTDAIENESKQLNSPSPAAPAKRKPTKLAPLNPESKKKHTALVNEIHSLTNELRKQRDKISTYISTLAHEQLTEREQNILLNSHSQEMLELKFEKDTILKDAITVARNKNKFLLMAGGLIYRIDELSAALAELENQRNTALLRNSIDKKKQEIKIIFDGIDREFSTVSALAQNLNKEFQRFCGDQKNFYETYNLCDTELNELRIKVAREKRLYNPEKADRLLEEFKRTQQISNSSEERHSKSLNDFWKSFIITKSNIEVAAEEFSANHQQISENIASLKSSFGVTRGTMALDSQLKEISQDFISSVFQAKKTIDAIAEQANQLKVTLIRQAITDNVDFWHKQVTITSSALIGKTSVPKIIEQLKGFLDYSQPEAQGEYLALLMTQMNAAVLQRPGHKRDDNNNLIYDSYFEKLKYTFFGVRKANTSKFCEIILKLDEIHPAILKQDLEAMGLKISSPDANKPRSGLEYKS